MGDSASMSWVFGILHTSTPPITARGICITCSQIVGIILGAVRKSTNVVKKKVISINETQKILLDNSNSII